MKTTLVVLALVASIILNLLLTGPRIAAGWRELRAEFRPPASTRTGFRVISSNRPRLAVETSFRPAVNMASGEVPNRRTDPLQITLELADGSRIVGIPEPSQLTLQTELGTLTIPWAKVVGFKLKTRRESVTLAAPPEGGTKVLALQPVTGG